MKRLLTVFLVIFMCIVYPVTRPAAAEAGQDGSDIALSLITDKRIGVTVGSSYEAYAKKNLPDAKIITFYKLSELSAALSSDKVDVIFDSYHTLSEMLKNANGLVLLDASFLSMKTGHAFGKNNAALRDEFNEFLARINEDGTLEDMYNRYIVERDYRMPHIYVSGKNGDYVFGTRISFGAPFVSLNENGEFIGFDVEIARRFAAYTDRRLVVRNSNFSGLATALTSGKIDAMGGHFGISEEGSKMFEFSDIVYTDTAGVVTTEKNLMAWTGYAVQTEASGALTALDELKSRIYNTFVTKNRYKLILSGLAATIKISLFSALFGTLLAALICYIRTSGSKPLRAIAKTYVVIMRGTPVLVLLLTIFFVVFHSIDISPAIAAVITFSMHFAAYASEVFRICINGVARAQWEAGLAGGFTSPQTFFYIILPQAMEKILPLFRVRFISLVQGTSIVGSIAAFDLTEAANFIQSSTYDAFIPYTVVLIVYFIISWTLILAFSYIERILASHRRKRV